MVTWGIKLDNYLLAQLKGEWSSLGRDEDWSDVYRVAYPPTLANPVEDVISTFQTHHPPYQVLIDTLIWQDRLYWTTARLYWVQFKKTTASEVIPNLHQLLARLTTNMQKNHVNSGQCHPGVADTLLRTCS